jgi:PAS domain S-box-containing protein
MSAFTALRTRVAAWARRAAPAQPDAQASHRLRLLLDHMPEAVLAFDEYGHIEWINPAARQVFQLSAADAVGRHISTWIAHLPPAMNAGAAGRADAMLPAQPVRQVVTARRRDGSSFPLEVSRVELPGAGLRAGMCVCRDVSEAQRMERMQHEFVSMVSHELRTPLTSLRGSLSLLNDGHCGELGPDANKLLRMAHTNAERLVHLVNDILEFEKLRAGAVTLDPSDEDLADVARQAVDALEGMAAQAEVRLVLAVEGAQHPVRADGARLAQVLANLLSNAIKHSPRHSTVQVRVVRHNERLRLTVRDAGPGVPQAFIPQLFMPFQQAHHTKARKQGGTGLGLAISRGLMERMHGAIGLELPQPDQGATFWIELPLNDVRPSTFGPMTLASEYAKA